MNICICAIAYNRVASLERLLSSLSSAYYENKYTLVISIDKSDTREVEIFAENYYWRYGEKRVIIHEHNLGLRKHVLSCGRLLEEFDAIVVLEDDIIVAPSFMYFVTQCVEKYYDDSSIAGISLYNFLVNYQTNKPFMPLVSDSDVYRMQCAMSWGQVWMRKSWHDFLKWYQDNSDKFETRPNLPETIVNWPKSSWLKYHTRYVIENNKFFIFPYVSLSTNNNEVGTHVKRCDTHFQSNLFYGKKTTFKLNPEIVYDGFFESMNLKLPYYDVCIDFYGEKNNRLKQRYWLTPKHLKFKIVKSYALNLKPYEWNIILDREGHDLFLYDTSQYANNLFHNNIHHKNDYLYNLPYTEHSIIKRLIRKIIYRIQQIL